MKTSIAILALLLPGIITADQMHPGPVTVADRDADSEILEIHGAQNAPTRRVTRLANGLSYRQGDEWLPAEARFEETPQGFVASRVQHPVRIAQNLNFQGAVALRTPAGTNLYSTPLAVTLSHGDDLIIIGVITNCTGYLAATNIVVFDDPFAGLCSSLVYSLTENSWDQSVYFNGRIDPREYGLPLDEKTELSIWTEFYQPERPLIARAPPRPPSPLPDETLTFGEDFIIGAGYAFTLPTPVETNGSWAAVRKEYKVDEDGRTFLVESFPVIAIAQGLLTLPECQESTQGALFKKSNRTKAYAALPRLPEHPAVAEEPAPRVKLLAKAQFLKRPAVVADYRAYISGTPVTLQSDVTYLVSGNFSCSSLSIAANTVCKFKQGASITVNGPVTCWTAKMRPAWFTSIDDDHVGECMLGFDAAYTGTNNPAGYANPAIRSSSAFSLSHCRFAFAQLALGDTGSPSDMIVMASHCQFVNCLRGVKLSAISAWNASIQLTNVLMAGVTYPLEVPGSIPVPYGSYRLVNCTFDRASILAPNVYPPVIAYNSIFANVTNSTPATNGTFTGSNNAFYNTPQQFGSGIFALTDYPFESAGAGCYYLSASSPLRNTALSSALASYTLNDLKQMTTYPPVVAGPAIWTNSLTLAPQAQRDQDSPDIGAHFWPVDYLLGGVTLSNCTLTVAPGTVIATFATNNFNFGLCVGSGGVLQSTGGPTTPVWFIPYCIAQEQTGTLLLQPTNGCLTSEAQGLSPGAAINCRFTQFSSPAQAVYHLNATTNTGPFNFQDCEFHSGQLRSAGPTINLTNCLLERNNIDIQPTDGLWTYIRNCHVPYSTFGVGPTNSVIADNIFYNSRAIPNWIGARGNTYTGYNAYYPTLPRLQPTKTGDKVLSSQAQLIFEIGPLGNYYQRSNNVTLNYGGTTANLVGLYHYTTCTNISGGYQVAETNSIVDMGLHYPVVDASGALRDRDADGLGDVIEDWDGDGVVDSTETSFLTADTDNDGVPDRIELLQGRSPLNPGAVPDDGTMRLIVHTPLK